MVLKNLYLALRNTLHNANIGIEFIELWNGQTENEDDDLPFNRPAVFIEFTSLPFERLPNKRYVSNTSVSLHLVSDIMQETSNIEDSELSDLGLAHLDLISDIMYTLDNYSDGVNGIGFITFSGIQQFDSQFTNIIHHIITLNVRLVEDAAKHATRTVTVTANATVQKQ